VESHLNTDDSITLMPQWQAQLFAEKLCGRKDFKLLAPIPLNTVGFHYEPPNYEGDLNELNARLLDRLNSSGKLYLTHTKLLDHYALRLVIAQTNTSGEAYQGSF